MIRRRILPVLVLSPLLFLSLAACTALGAEPAAPGTQTATETTAASPGLEASLPPTETQVPVTLPDGSEGAVVAATTDLATRLGISTQEIQTIGVEAEEWSDASLGCPQPDMLYAQVITPGFRIVLQAGDQAYAYHTDRGTRAVLCGPDGKPVLPGTPAATGWG